jgi:hypothetical protein
MVKPFDDVFRGCQKPNCYALVKPRNISARMKRTTGRHAKFLFCNLGKQEQNGADDILDYGCHGTRFNPLKRCFLIFAFTHLRLFHSAHSIDGLSMRGGRI